MVWFKIDDGFYSHPKVVSIPRSIRVVAIGTWTLAGTWSAAQMTDGVIPIAQVEELGGSMEGALALVKAKLWTKTATAFRFRSWGDYQPTRAAIEEARENERVRKAQQRADAKARDAGKAPGPRRTAATGSTAVPNVSQWDTGGSPAAVQVPRPDPTRPDPLPPEGGRASATAPPVDNSEERPGPFCPRHPRGTDGSCRACGNARRAHDAWTAPHPSRRQAWDPATHCEHGQLVGRCETCEYEASRGGSTVIRGPWGAA